MGYELGKRSKQRLEGVHPDLVAVVKLAISRSNKDFTVLEGLRSVDRQKELVATGKSKTMNSRHLNGHAVDIAPWPISWEWEDYYPIADVIKECAEELGVELEWGGAWHIKPFYLWEGSSKSAHEAYIEERESQGRKPFGDAPHFQLSRSTYP